MKRLFVLRELIAPLIVAGAVIGAVLLWLHNLPPPFYYRNPLAIEWTKHKPGDFLPMLADRCNTTGKTLIVVTTRKLIRIDDTSVKPVTIPGTNIAIEKGCKVEPNRSIRVPLDTPKGAYVVAGFICPINTFLASESCVPFQSPKFEVEP